MSALSSFLSRSFDFCGSNFGTAPITSGAVTKTCLLDSAQATKTLMESGLWSKATHTIELTRANFAALTIVDRKVVTIAGVQYRVILIEGADDQADPCIRVHLRLAHLA